MDVWLLWPETIREFQKLETQWISGLKFCNERLLFSCQIMETSMTESSGGMSDESDLMSVGGGSDQMGMSASGTQDNLFRYVCVVTSLTSCPTPLAFSNTSSFSSLMLGTCVHNSQSLPLNSRVGWES